MPSNATRVGTVGVMLGGSSTTAFKLKKSNKLRLCGARGCRRRREPANLFCEKHLRALLTAAFG